MWQRSAVVACVLLICVKVLHAQQNFEDKSLTGSSQADFTDQDCSGANFKSAQLYDPQFVRTNLHNASFSHCTVNGGSFALADLEGADFSDADLTNANLADAKNLGKAIFHRTKFRKLDDTDLSGADLHGLNLSQNHFIKANLRGAKLSHCDLTQADFTDADLRDADLSSCNLTQADLRGADLRGADLTGSTLTQMWVSGADLSTAKGLDPNLANDLMTWDDPAKLPPNFPPPMEAPPYNDKTLAQLRDQPDMYGTDMRRMNLNHAELSELRMQGSRLPRDLRGANMREINATSIKVENADFTDTDLDHADLMGSWLIGAKLGGAKNLGSANLASCRLDRCDLSNALASDSPGLKLSNAILRAANLSGAKLSGADLSWTSLVNANLRNCDLANARLAGAVVIGVDFTGANLSGVDAQEVSGLTQSQLDQMAQKPKDLPVRLDPAKRVNVAAGSNGSSHEPDDDESSASSPMFVRNWTRVPALRRQVIERFAISLGITVALTLLIARGKLPSDSNETEDRWQKIMGAHFRFTSKARNNENMQVINPAGVRIWPSLETQAAELPLPIRIEFPAKIGPASVRRFILINGLVVSIMVGLSPILLSRAMPTIVCSAWALVLIVWWLLLLALRGRLIMADRSQVVIAIIKAANPAAPARVRIIPTNQFRVVTYHYKGRGETLKYLELNTGHFMPTTFALGEHSASDAFAMRDRLSRSLKIPALDEARTEPSSD